MILWILSGGSIAYCLLSVNGREIEGLFWEIILDFWLCHLMRSVVGTERVVVAIRTTHICDRGLLPSKLLMLKSISGVKHRLISLQQIR